MTDKQIRILCAEAMGWTHLGAVGEPYYRGIADGKIWCMSGSNDWWLDPEGHRVCGPCQGIPDPIEERDHAMRLLEKLGMSISPMSDENLGWEAELWQADGEPYSRVVNVNLLRAISECAAAAQAQK